MPLNGLIFIKAGKDVAFSETAEIFYHIGLQLAVCF
jgi:hypothetical protein